MIHVALAAVLVAGGIGLASHLPHRGDAATPVKATAPLFRVRGKVTGLFPGRRITLRARLRNPYDFPIVARRVRATVTSPVPGCPKTAVKVRRWKGRRLLRPHAARRVPLRVTMRRAAPDACQGVRFTLSFTGKAVRP